MEILRQVFYMSAIFAFVSFATEVHLDVNPLLSTYVTEDAVDIEKCPNKENLTKPDSACFQEYGNGYPTECSEVYLAGNIENGEYIIWPRFFNKPITVYCDMKTAGGGWTVFQRRDDYKMQEDFFRNWVDYKVGFGNMKEDFWLGNDILFAITSQKKMILRVELEDFEGKTVFAEYNSMIVRSETEQYKLLLGTYSGDAGDSFTSAHTCNFVTKDRDHNDCSAMYKGGWWYGKCHDANLNGLYLRAATKSYADGVVWKEFRGYHYSLKKSVMMLRPASFDQY